MSFAISQETRTSEPPAISPRSPSRYLYQREANNNYIDEDQSNPTGPDDRKDQLLEQDQQTPNVYDPDRWQHIPFAPRPSSWTDRQTPGSEYYYRPSEALQVTSKGQLSYPFQVARQLPPSPASTASDQSENSEQSSTSDFSSQSDYGSISPTESPLANPGRYVQGVKGAKSRLHHCVTSSTSNECLSDGGDSQSDCDSVTPAGVSGGNGNSINSNNNTDNVSTPDRVSQSQTCEGQVNHLPYRTKSENSSTYYKSVGGDEARLKEPPSGGSLASSQQSASTESSNPRCLPAIFHVFSGVASSQVTPTCSPQNQQANSRRRPVNLAVPPPRLRRDTDNTDAIVKMIVIFCTNLIQSIWPVDNVSTSAQCGNQAQPGGNVLPLQVFITETLRRSKTSYSTLQIALYYLILLRQCMPELTCPGQSSQPGCRAMMCGRRMFLTALILASKYLQDRNYSARAWSKISGLPMKEINDNERRYLRFVGWDLHVPKEAFENWSKIVLAICRLSTGQDTGDQDFDGRPPSPDAMASTTTPQLQKEGQSLDMRSGSRLHKARSWWIFNLRGLCTDIVRCPQRTEKYVLSIPHLRDGPVISRPLFENKPNDYVVGQTNEQESLPSVQKLSRPSSMECIKASLPVDLSSNPPTCRTMPPPPPMLSNLPTPQTTPRFDVASIWKSNASRSSSRCRDSASLLRNVDRTCTIPGMEKFPVPRCSLPPPNSLASGTSLLENKLYLSQLSPTSSSQQSFRARQAFQAPDRSLTSSPESVVSDISSWSGFVGRSRTSSFSSTSSRSTLSQLNFATSDLEQCEGFKRQLNTLDAQIAPRVHDWTSTTGQKESDPCTPTSISRPRTAFRTSILRPGCFEVPIQTKNAELESMVDEGYCSGDHSHDEREQQEKQAATIAPLDLQYQTELDKTAAQRCSTVCKPMLSRPTLSRSNTQVFAPTRLSCESSYHTLKRSRSESFDTTSEPCAKNLGMTISSITKSKDVQHSWQPWAASRQPIQCQAQDMNKRIAVQSAAACRASRDLRREACGWLKCHSRA